MLKSSKTTIPLLSAILLFVGAEANAQASDVDCSKCVDTADIANFAVGSGKIANGAVTSNKLANQAVTGAKIENGSIGVSKVGPKLKNDIGMYCEPGQVVVGKDANGFLVCESRLYYPYGPQVNIPESTLSGWTQCYQSLYNDASTPVADVLAQCDGDKLLMACRPVGETNFTLLAAGRRDDVTMDTTNDNTTLHSANGVGWYFHTPSKSWGFVRDGNSVSKNSCDTADSGAADERMCLHINGSANISGGYRCGATEALNSNDQWERIIYTAN